ncbi:MAG: hypothetical protein QXE31_00195 [Candidatus Woesearchaeota archaeon]
MLVFPENSISNSKISDLEEKLKEIRLQENVALLFLEEKGPFGSLKTDAFVRKVLAELKRLNQKGYYVMPVVDGNSPYVLREISEKDKEALNRRINYQENWKPKLLELLQNQVNLKNNGVYQAQEGSFIRLSITEDRFYHLQTVNNENELGFPGAWMLYYTDKKGFWIQKIEPILIIPSCLVCPYGMIENLVNQGYNMEQKQQEILQRLNYNGEKRRRNRPYDCPNPQCDLVFSHNEYGKVYRPRERAFSFPISLNEIGQGYSIIQEKTPTGLKIAKIKGPLRKR